MAALALHLVQVSIHFDMTIYEEKKTSIPPGVRSAIDAIVKPKSQSADLLTLFA